MIRDRFGEEGPLRRSDEQRENEALRERISTLSAAILRISATLDLDTVLGEVVESARALTGARYGVITTVGESGELQDFVTSGFAPEEHVQLAAWPDGPRLLEHLRDLPGPLRLADLSGYVRSLGLAPARMFSRAFQGTPMRHRGVNVGNFFLAEKAGGEEFTGEDEAVLMLFASQAAAAIANARTHRAEQRARADLEALIETSPVGVVVFDAKSGHPVSFNREGRRIVESLRMPGHPAEQLLEVLTCRFADGREFALAEIPLARHLESAETVRAEEMVLSVPDGRSVRTLVNVTPIRAEGAGIGSVVVTMQDLAPLDELERMRAEFLGMVSHELREPLTSIKGSAVTLLEESAELDPAEMREFSRIIVEQANHMRGLIGDLLDAGRIDTGTLSVSPEPSELAGLVDRARNTFLSGGGRHTVLIDLPPALPGVMADRRRIVQVLNNLFSNAARHAPESSPIRVSAVRDGAHVAVAVSDAGRGGGAGARAASVSQARRRRRGRNAGLRLGARDLQGAGRGARGADPGRERRNRPGHDVHLHDSGGRGDRPPGDRPRPGFCGPVARRAGAGPHPRRRRRPADAALRPRRALGGRLRPACDGRAGAARAHRPGREAAAGPARPDAARHRRHRTDATGPPSSPTCRSSSSPPTAATRPSRGHWKPAPTTTSSSPSRRRSLSHGSGRRCEGARNPNRSCWASSPSTMGRAG